MKQKKREKTVLRAVITVAVAALFVGIALVGRKKNMPVSRSEFLLDTVCTVTLYDGGERGEAILEEAFALCGRYERLFSVNVSGSDVYRINHSGGQPVEISEETASLLADALVYGRISGGAFDVTVEPVTRLWHFDGSNNAIPDESTLREAVALVGGDRLRIEGRTATLPDGMGIDLGAIAKGYVADRLADCLRANGVKSAIIDLGGNIYALGERSEGFPWRVGIKQPFGSGNAAKVEVRDASVVTSGVYQRYFERDGQIYHHILDARTGMPCDSGLHSVSVVGECSAQCDALSTVCMLVGYERGCEILSQYDGLRAVFITDQGEVKYYGNP